MQQKVAIGGFTVNEIESQTKFQFLQTLRKRSPRDQNFRNKFKAFR